MSCFYLIKYLIINIITILLRINAYTNELITYYSEYYTNTTMIDILCGLETNINEYVNLIDDVSYKFNNSLDYINKCYGKTLLT